MRSARLVVLGIALAAGLAAAMLARGRSAPEPQARSEKPSLDTTDVLVAAKDIPMGNGIGAGDLKWQAWPSAGIPSGAISRRDDPNALSTVPGAIARTTLAGGEPIRRDKIIKTDGSGFLSAILPTGMRAMAIAIDNRGTSTAGGFILPGDRVDVILTRRDEEASKRQGFDVVRSETILRNIRVLAIGPNVQEKSGEKVVNGDTATLEVDAAQAEAVALAQKLGLLSLALRSLADAKAQDRPASPDQPTLTVVRFGVATEVPRR